MPEESIKLLVNENLIQTKSQRYPEVDALRGLAIAGIFFYHSIAFFNYPATYVETNALLSKIDSLIDRGAYLFLFGKMYGIFVFLFGFTFQLQAERNRNTQRSRLIWRLVILFLFGLFNSLLLPNGDILVLYSLIGLIMMPVVFLKTPVLIGIAIFLLLQPIELLKAFTAPVSPVGASSLFNTLKEEIYHALERGDFLQIIRTNLTKGVPASLLWDLQSGRVSQAAGLYLLGFITARADLFNRFLFKRKFWLKLTFVFGAPIVAIWLAKKYLTGAGSGLSFQPNVDLALGLWINTLSALLIISAFTFLYHLTKGRYFNLLGYLGRMSFTNYISQSLLGALLFAPYAFNLGNKIGVTYSFLLTCALLLLQALISKSWLHTHQRGPLENFWYRLTWIGCKKRNQK